VNPAELFRLDENPVVLVPNTGSPVTG